VVRIDDQLPIVTIISFSVLHRPAGAQQAHGSKRVSNLILSANHAPRCSNVRTVLRMSVHAAINVDVSARTEVSSHLAVIQR